ncbi:MAG: phosphate acyltransferase PlsX [Pseudomonadales bacterium]|nr:phosphate acyltransferase PlsX [Pseudomonadales bacterium]NRA17808.1 phosphate acyltransferase PlsX [Oceanospirillaceae bacterium]
MSDRVSIAIDVMGGDLGLHTVLPAAIAALARHPSLFLILCGNRAQIDSYLNSHTLTDNIRTRLTVTDAQSVVAMSDTAAFAIRHRRDSSMYIALTQVAEGAAQACVSAGNTGALMAMSCLLIKTIKGISRPAIVASMPTVKGQCLMLDLGANINCKAENLYQFAVMGSALASGLYGLKKPKIGLLNIGSEENKGLVQVVAAAQLLEAQPGLNYRGFIEGDEVFSGRADVVVCDGFAGNVLLKTSEGLAKFINVKVARNLKKNLFRRVLTWVAAPVLHEIRQQLDPASRNGAILLGLQAVVVKSHGAATKHGVGCAIDQALMAVECDLVAIIEREMLAVQPTG